MESCGGPAPPPAATGKASRRKAEQDSSLEAADDETVAKAADQKTTDGDASCDFEDGPDDDDVIRNFNKMGRMKLFTPEFIEDLKKEHRMHIALCLKHHEDVLMEERHGAAAQSSS
jgi:hypothetical protein